MVITNHAQYRCKERCGLPKRAINNNAEKAFRYGVSHKECTGRLKKYMDYLYLSHQENHANNIRLYGNFTYIFSSIRLITVLPIPKEHINAVHKIIRRKKVLNDKQCEDS